MAAAPRIRFHSSAIDRLRTTALESGAPSSRQIAPCLTRRRAGARHASSASPTRQRADRHQQAEHDEAAE